MTIFQLTLRNIKGNSVRSVIIFLCVLGIAGFFLSTTLIIRGAEYSLQLGLEKLGADILVVPQGAESRVETALLMGRPTEIWMPEDYIQKLAKVAGVGSVSSQVYLSSLYGASCCAVSEMFLVVFDPATDFTIKPWLEKKQGGKLGKGEVIGGSYVLTPPGEQYITLYGHNLSLKGNLEATGTGIDQTMFMSMDTAQDMALTSLTKAERPLKIPADSISAVLIKVAPGTDAHKVALQIMLDVPGVAPIESPNLFGTFRRQMTGLLWGFLAILSIASGLSAVLIGLVFSMAANERQRQIAVLRALGATRFFVFGSLVSEAAVLALGAGILGITLSALIIYIFRDFIAGSLGMPFLFPSFSSLLLLFAVGIALSLLTVSLAALVPAVRISRQEPAMAMRE